MQTDLVLELPPGGDYENIIAAIDVPSRYTFAYPVTSSTAVNTVEVIIVLMKKHDHPPKLMITDKGSIFNSQVISEVAAAMAITLKHATTKHVQLIGILERTHAAIKTSLEMASGENRKQWQNYPPLATLNYNTSYHTNLESEPTRVFHERVPYNILDRKQILKTDLNFKVITDFADELLRRTETTKPKRTRAVICQKEKLLWQKSKNFAISRIGLLLQPPT